MVNFVGLTLFDQKNVICNTPCLNVIVNTIYYDTRHFAKVVNRFELEGTWFHPPTQGYTCKDMSTKVKWTIIFWEISPSFDLRWQTSLSLNISSAWLSSIIVNIQSYKFLKSKWHLEVYLFIYFILFFQKMFPSHWTNEKGLITHIIWGNSWFF